MLTYSNNLSNTFQPTFQPFPIISEPLNPVGPITPLLNEYDNSSAAKRAEPRIILISQKLSK